MSATTWDPNLYLAFDDHRSRPFRDLLARVGAEAPRRVIDMGCGPGHLTGLLAARWPDAAVTAFDSSADMVAAARARASYRMISNASRSASDATAKLIQATVALAS